MQTLMQDVKYAVRMLLKAPAFAAVAILTLALGIGANTAMFSVLYAVVLQPLPYRDAERVVIVRAAHPERSSTAVSHEDFKDWRSQNTSFSGISAFSHWTFNWTGRDVPERVIGGRTSGEFFDVLGVRPVLGRTYTMQDDQPGKEFVAVLSYRIWQRMFGGDAKAIGTAINLNSQLHTVIGVMPPEFRFPAEDVEIWAPIGEQMGNVPRGARFMMAVARLKDGVSEPQAQKEMSVITARLAGQYPATNKDWGASVVAAHEALVRRVRPALVTLLGAVAFVLLIACANVANLVLARSATRHRELAVRAALGASRARLMRQLITEGALLAMIGGALGLALAYAAVQTVRGLPLRDVPRLDTVGVQWPVLAFTLALAVITGVALGALPGWRVLSRDLRPALAEGSRGILGRNRLGNVFMVAQIALALVLLTGGGLLLRSMSNLLAVNPGFDPGNVLKMNAFLTGPKYVEVASRHRFVTQTLERIQQIPGVVAAGSISRAPLADFGTSFGLEVEGRQYPVGQAPSANYVAVSPDIFRTLGVPLLRGRSLEEHDTLQSPAVIIVNEAMARQFWSGEEALGRRIKVMERNTPWMTVVGVVANVRADSLDAEDKPTMYAPHTQCTFPWMRFHGFLVRTSGEPQSHLAAVRAAIHQLDPDLPLYGISTMDRVVAGSLAERRFNTTLLASFAGLALVLAAIGIYGVMAYSATQRTREMGIRMALGAQPRDVWRLVVGQALKFAVAGLAIGIAGAAALTRSLEKMLFGVKPTDAATFSAAAALLMVVAMLASYLPARRASRVDPLVALREE